MSKQDFTTVLAEYKTVREKWQRRLNRAVNAIRRIDAKVKRLERKQAEDLELKIDTVADLFGDDKLDIPPFLDRRDQEAAEKLKAEQTEHKRKKALGRIARLKADKSGERKRMPLTGKGALAAIREAP